VTVYHAAGAGCSTVGTLGVILDRRRQAAYVVGVLLHQVGVQVDQRGPHPRGMFLVNTKHYRFSKAVGLPKE